MRRRLPEQTKVGSLLDGTRLQRFGRAAPGKFSRGDPFPAWEDELIASPGLLGYASGSSEFVKGRAPSADCFFNWIDFIASLCSDFASRAKPRSPCLPATRFIARAITRATTGLRKSLFNILPLPFTC